MEITFLGAAETVTGSRFLVRARGATVLVDCGLFQGLKALRLRNRDPFPVPPASLDAVVLTHAHLDHTGYLPALVRDGFRGPVWCTAATADLTDIILRDSGKLQEEEAGHANRHGWSKHAPALPLYTAEDAARALETVRTAAFGARHALPGGLAVTFRPAGHIPGAAGVLLEGDGVRIFFSGDVGRPGDPLLPDPAPPPAADAYLVESTYGDRDHPDVDPADELAEVVVRTAARGGAVLIPAFAVGRAQTLLWHLARLKRAGRIPDLPVFLDSPMASRALRVLRDHPESHRLSEAEARALGAVADATESVEESKRIDRMTGPRIVLSASGMATGGRVLHHLKAMAPDPRNTVLFAGYQAPGTRGADLVRGAPTVKIHGGPVEVNCEVEVLDALSAHADAGELIAWLRTAEGAPERVFLTHGEPAALHALRDRIRAELGWRATVPRDGEGFGV